LLISEFCGFTLIIQEIHKNDYTTNNNEFTAIGISSYMVEPV